MHRLLTAALVVAAAAGLAHGAFSISWALGSTFMIDTVGLPLTRMLVEDPEGLRRNMAFIAVIKVMAALVPLLLLRRVPGLLRRAIIIVSWLGAGWLLLTSVQRLSGNAAALARGAPFPDGTTAASLTWQISMWQPVFILWSCALLLALVLIARRTLRTRSMRRREA